MTRTLLRFLAELRTPTSSQTLRICPSAAVATRSMTTTSQSSFTGTTQQIDPPPLAPEAVEAAISRHPTPRKPAPTKPSPLAPPKPLSESIRALLPALRTQPAHYITIHIHGFPYLVTVGDSLRLPSRIPNVKPGDVLRLNRASILGSRDYTLKGSPYIDERMYECRAIVTSIEAEPMRVEVKKKQRCRRKTHVKSKLRFTVMRISELKIKSVEEIEESMAAEGGTPEVTPT